MRYAPTQCGPAHIAAGGGEEYSYDDVELQFLTILLLRPHKRTANDTTIACVAVAGLEVLEQLLAKLPSIGLCVQSRTTHAGEAAEAILLYRTKAPQLGMTIYGPWDYNVERAAQRAIACVADGIEMPGIAPRGHPFL
jgi:hypothetical protein